MMMKITRINKKAFRFKMLASLIILLYSHHQQFQVSLLTSHRSRSFSYQYLTKINSDPIKFLRPAKR